MKYYYIIQFILICIFLLLSLAIFGLWIYAIITYGNTPLSEVPAWVYWILTAGRK